MIKIDDIDNSGIFHLCIMCITLVVIVLILIVGMIVDTVVDSECVVSATINSDLNLTDYNDQFDFSMNHIFANINVKMPCYYLLKINE